MPEIVGPFDASASSLPPISAHVEHLRHLNNPKIGRELLRDQHGFNTTDAKNTAKLVAEYIDQSLAFHEASVEASQRVRPVLQYYCYLNMAVVAILVFRPTNTNQYTRHGVEDLSHRLTRLELGSTVVKVKSGAVPLFHSILSDVSLAGRKLRLKQLLAGFHGVSHELRTQFGRPPVQNIRVADSVTEDTGRWYSEFKFTCTVDGHRMKFNKKRIEKAVPILTKDYSFTGTFGDIHQYRSSQSWANETNATKQHRKNGLKIINFGGHGIARQSFGSPTLNYMWRGQPLIDLIPTLTCTLLTSFAFASVARYRPNLVSGIIDSPMQLVHTAFTMEADAIFIPSLRNLIFREEYVIARTDFT